MDKLIRDGKVAVLISGGYGAGWSSWTDHESEMLFNPEIAQMVLDEKSNDEIIAVAEAKWPEAYLGGIDGLHVVWLPVGTEFRVTEYDGAESIQIKQDTNWIVA
jgi:hypothetical protein